MSAYTPKTGAKCSCKPGVYRDNCPNCEGTGWAIDFRAIHARRLTGGYNVTCSRCDRAFSSSTDFHTHVVQGCK
jgi:hypothetical protein